MLLLLLMLFVVAVFDKKCNMVKHLSDDCMVRMVWFGWVFVDLLWHILDF